MKLDNKKRISIFNQARGALKRNVLRHLYLPLRFFHHIGKVIIPGKRTRLRILLFHDIPSNCHTEFRRKLEFLSKHWNFISPEELEKYLNGEASLDGDNLLLSFDDGFYSNRVIAEDILNPMRIKALFFVVSDFIKLNKHEDQIKFIQNNLYPKWRKHAYPENLNAMRSLSFDDLSYLHASGHTIGCHTATHPDLSAISDKNNLIDEIINSANELEDRLSIAIQHFSYGFGHASFFSKEALQVARSRFSYVYTGMRGDNAKSINPWAIRRDAIAADDSLYLMGAYIEGIADFRYKKDFLIYQSWDV